MLRLLAFVYLFTVIVAAPSDEVAEKHTVESEYCFIVSLLLVLLCTVEFSIFFLLQNEIVSH